MPERIADLILERFRLDELPADAQRTLVELRRRDADVDRRISAIELSDAEVAAKGFLRELTAHVRSRLTFAPRRRRRSRAWMIPALAMLVLVVLIWIPVDRETERVKGSDAALSVFRQTAGGSETLADDAVVHEGDLIRVGYRVSTAGYGVIVSIDGRGAVSQHLPADGSQAVQLAPGAMTLVEGAFELDDAPLMERFFFFTSAEPFPSSTVLDAVRRSGGVVEKVRVPAGMHFVTFSLRKDAGR